MTALRGKASLSRLGDMALEMNILHAVMQDIDEVLRASRSEKELVGRSQSQALEMAYDLCQKRFNQTADHLDEFGRGADRANSLRRRVMIVGKYVRHEHEVQLTYRLLRESIILARDMASE